jgi:hypothetical protein
MREIGIDLTARQPQRLTDALARNASMLVTMGCGDECPYVPGLERADWPLRDPKDRPLAEVRAIRDEIRDRVTELVNARGWGRGGVLTPLVISSIIVVLVMVVECCGGPSGRLVPVNAEVSCRRGISPSSDTVGNSHFRGSRFG